jgi:hypothetical protein
LGRRAFAAIEVAIAFAVSWNPLVKSNAEAATITATTMNETWSMGESPRRRPRRPASSAREKACREADPFQHDLSNRGRRNPQAADAPAVPTRQPIRMFRIAPAAGALNGGPTLRARTPHPERTRAPTKHIQTGSRQYHSPIQTVAEFGQEAGERREHDSIAAPFAADDPADRPVRSWLPTPSVSSPRAGASSRL